MSLASDVHKFIYVRVPRTGSTTFTHHLEETYGTDLIDVGGQHATAFKLKRLWDDKWEEYQTFGYIRNPWDWLVSVYNSGVSVGANCQEKWQGSKLGNGTPERTNFSFDEWVRQRKTTAIDWLTNENEVIVDEVRLAEDFYKTTTIRKSAVPHSPYREWYLDDLAEYVARKCSREIEIGNYTF